jgi:hypothetical protein
MGNEARIPVEIGTQRAEAKVLLETEDVIVRGDLRGRFPFSEMKELASKSGVLSFDFHGERVHLHLGDDAVKWELKIRNPKSVIDKLGIKHGQKVTIAGTLDDASRAAIEERSGDVSSSARKGSDVIFLAAETIADLDRLDALRQSLQPAGAIWVVHRKGDPRLKDTDVMRVAKASGLVDVKVVAFSKTHTAEKLVIPVKERTR